MSQVSFLLVEAGRRQLGLPLASVQGVEPLGPVQPVPSRDAACQGVTSARGQLLPVLDLAVLVSGAGGSGETAVLLRLGDRPCCLQVDDAVAIVSGDLLPVPAGESLTWASGVVARPEGLVPLVDPDVLVERLLPPEAS